MHLPRRLASSQKTDATHVFLARWKTYAPCS
jgi:hypothetical protein